MLNTTIKSEILSEILNSNNFLGKYSDNYDILTFLGKIWDLKILDSEDSRYKNAYEDIQQHFINNDDWSIEYLLKTRLDLINGDEKYFILFIEAVVSPLVRNNKNEILIYVTKINSHLENSDNKLILTDYFEDLPVYRYKNKKDLNDLPLDIIENKIPIYKYNYNGNRTYPSFYLGYDRWDDFGNVTMFDIVYQENENSFNNIGKVKIMKSGVKTTWNELPDSFTTLSNEFCSLGQKDSYYFTLKTILQEDYYSFLLGLRDAAIFPKINEQFENDDIFRNSLIRDNKVERILRTIRYEIEGVKPIEYFKFNYIHQPPYAENEIIFNFDFEYNSEFEHRIFALIGKNGTGKTWLLSKLAKQLSEKDPNAFKPRKPIYGKVFTVSYSFFDKFELPTSDASFNYKYCGLKKNKNTWKTNDELISDFLYSTKLIKAKNLEYDWYLILSNFISKEILAITFETYQYNFNIDKFGEMHKVLSSGQSIILFLISEILSRIRYDSLILFDEPETHLHPNAISSLINTLYLLVKKFDSFCIIGTHSPIIIQEIPARNIFVLERSGNKAILKNLERESLGENLTTITQDIFGNREVPKHFVTLIEELLRKGKSEKEIIDLLETDNLPISSNIKLYIKSLSK